MQIPHAAMLPHCGGGVLGMDEQECTPRIYIPSNVTQGRKTIQTVQLSKQAPILGTETKLLCILHIT